MEYKFDKIKEKCKASIQCRYSYELLLVCIGAEGLATLSQKRDSLKKEVFHTIDNWDVREVDKLIRLFPECIAKQYRDQRAYVEYDSEGEWVVIFKTQDRSGDPGFYDRSY
jgi:hypothetical protein